MSRAANEEQSDGPAPGLGQAINLIRSETAPPRAADRGRGGGPPPPGLIPDRQTRLLAAAREMLHREAAALAALGDGLDQGFLDVVDLLASCPGRVVVSGMGRSGFVARQVAATLVRTGIPAFFLHPADAVHGDLGAVMAGDLALVISRSGTTAEVLTLLPHLRRRCRAILALVGDGRTPLAAQADLVLEVAAPQEPAGTPLAWSLATQGLADALAVAAMTARGLTPEALAVNHPGGAAGSAMANRARGQNRRLPWGAGGNDP